MSGKPYTIGEFKIIVDYLVENKLYGEIKARKMWVDFANTKLTTRTWQSLKETFLKRILPDIHNPYFRLTNEQISSFRARCDLADRNKNSLEIQTISDDSSSNGNSKNNEPSNDEGENTAGENTKCSKIPLRSRSSADTVILENCYETAEEIQKELESRDSDDKPKSKSLRDCITYSEPLTPMLQEVLDDFASEPEDSDKEGRMEIVDSVPENDNSEDVQQIPESENQISNTKSVSTDVAKNAKGLSAEVVEEVLAQELDGGSKPENKSPKKTQNITDDLEDKISSMLAENGTENCDDNVKTADATNFFTADSTENPVVQNTENTVVQNTENTVVRDTKNPVVQDSETTEVSVANDSHSEPQVQSGALNHSNSTVDASLPNNPEALKNKQSTNIDANNKEAQENAIEVSNNSDKTQGPSKATRKRSCSEDNLKTIENKKKKLAITLKSPLDKPITESHLDTNAENEQLKTNNKESVKPDKIKELVLEETASNLNKPSTSFENHVEDIIETGNRNNENESAEILNPCLQNVSLFDEQFNKTRYNMSESSDTEQNKKETQVDTQEATVSKATNDVMVLNSHSESDAQEVHNPPKKKHRAGVLSSKSERDKAIANMFGFTSGGVGSKRKRQLSRRRRTISHNNASHHNAAAVSNSSDWTSDSESETFVSPPRGRKNRPTRKYLKPQAGKILSLEEEGGLFVMYGKKIYPLIKDGKIVKNYITYLPESDSEEGESFWKLKYVEEKKKAAELKKLLEQANEPRLKNRASPILQANPLRNSTTTSSSHQAGEPSNGVGTEICLPEPNGKKEETKVNPPEKIKIKFTKNNEEVHLEGHWPQIHPVLEQVVQIFHKEAEPSTSDRKSKMIVEVPDNSKEPSSGHSTPVVITPVDPETREKVDKIEKEIFKEIEKRDREEENVPNGLETNVTKRKIGRPRKSSSSAQSPLKQPKISNGLEIKESEENNRTRRQKAKETENKVIDNQVIVPNRQTRTPRKILNESVNTNDTRTIQTRRSKQMLDTSKTNDEEVRYMLPRKNKRQSLQSPAKKHITQRPQRSMGKIPKIFSSPDNFSLNSMESTQGYQDSDISPVKTEIKKKKKLDVSSYVIKTRNSLRRSTKRRSHPYLHCDAYNDSSNMTVDAPVQVARDNSSLNTDAYRSESYQLLMPPAQISLRQLESIDEKSPIGNETYFVKHLESMSKNEISAQINNFASHSGQITSDVGSSSNVSLPMSPELSVVENMSISKEILSSIEDFPTINEIQSNELNEPTMCSKYNMISDVDVSVPLMQQECEFERCNTITEVSVQPKDIVTESLLNKIDTFNINDQVADTPLTDTLDKKLHDLLLDSAKKITRSQSAQNKESMMEVDVTSVEVQNKKAKTNKKRCSTPQKRKGSKKSVAPKVDPVVEEEHMESCSHSGRKSCPPLFHAYLCNENVVGEEINIANLTIANEKPKAKKKKKDIIRVKIQRPKNKTAEAKLRTKSAQNASRISVFTDSGINDTESEVFLPVNDSVDLIHNHSETCLHANECVGDSLEFVENSKSVITLGDSMQSGDNVWNSRSENHDEHSISPDLFCNNAQDVSFYNKANIDNIDNTSDTVYHSPLGTEASPNSLITEDLSDDAPQQPARPTKWYLLSEDETNNTNMVGKGSTMLNSGSFESNLKQLFPITCAIPDLSTITEMSRENDSSRKPTLEDIDGLTGEDFDSQSVFDSNF